MTIAVLATVHAGYARPVPKDRLDYAGQWRSRVLRSLILADGSIAYERFQRGATTSTA